MNRQTFLDSFSHIADSPGGVDKLRHLILDLAARGTLVRQNPRDAPASELLKQVAKERAEFTNAGRARRSRPQQPVLAPEVPYPASPGWAWTRIGTLFGMQAGSNVPAGTIRDSGLYPCYGGNGVRGYVGSFNRDGSYPIIGRQGALCGNIKVAHGRFYATEHAVVVDCFAGTSVAWAALALEALDLNQYATATAQPGLSVERISGVPIALPPVQEQHRIVERVDELMALCDQLEEQQGARVESRSALIAATLHRTDADAAVDLRADISFFAERIDLHLAPGEGDLVGLKRLRQTIVDLAVRGRLTHQDPADEPATELLARIAAERDHLIKTKVIRKPKPFAATHEVDCSFVAPLGWSWCRLGDLLVTPLANGRSVPTRVGGFPVLRLTAMRGDIINLGERKGGDWSEQQASPYLVAAGDIFVARGNGSINLVGRASRVIEDSGSDPIAYPDTMIRIQPPTDAIDLAFLTFLWNSRPVRIQVELKARTTAGIYKVSQDDLRDIALAIPPLAEQCRIVERMGELMALCDELEQQFLVARSQRGDLAASIAAHVAPDRADEAV